MVLAHVQHLCPSGEDTRARRPWPAVNGPLLNGPVVSEPTDPPTGAAYLSGRDLAVLRLLAEGQSTANIAVALAYSESTIKNVIHDLVRNLGARNRAHAVAMAIRGGLI